MLSISLMRLEAEILGTFDGLLEEGEDKFAETESFIFCYFYGNRSFLCSILFALLFRDDAGIYVFQ